MENNEQVEAQAMLIKDNPFRVASIGADAIDWYADMGNPTSVAGATLSNNASYDGNNLGVILTPAADSEGGALSWDETFDWDKDILITANLAAGDGDGGDGILMYLGASDPQVGPGNGYGSLNVFIDEFNSDTIKVYNGDTLLETYSFGTTIDTGEFRNWQLLSRNLGGTRTLRLYCNGVHIFQVETGAWTQGGNLVGVSAYTGASNNLHLCRAFSVKYAGPFLAMNSIAP